MDSNDNTAFNRLVKIMDELREQCPWDKKQTLESLRHLTIEETYELSDAIVEGDMVEIKKELGDLMLHNVFYARIASETNIFDMADVLNAICAKLIERHPHVYGDVVADTEQQVKSNWEKIKRAEKHGTHLERKSAFDGIPKHLPALLRAEKLLKKARKAKVIVSHPASKRKIAKTTLARELFELVSVTQSHNWCAEELLAGEVKKQERKWRRQEQKHAAAAAHRLPSPLGGERD